VLNFRNQAPLDYSLNINDNVGGSIKKNYSFPMDHFNRESTLRDVYSCPLFSPFQDFLFTLPEDFLQANLDKTFAELDGSAIQADNLLMCFNEFYRRRKKGEQLFYRIYDQAEQNANPFRRHTGYFALPVEGTSDKPFFFLAAGGGYEWVFSTQETGPIAVALVQHSYSVFMVHYSIKEGAHFPYPLEDLSAALKDIFAHQKDFGISNRYYAAGFSASAHLMGIFASKKLGAPHYQLPRPQGLILGYPVITMGPKSHPSSRLFFLGKENASDPAVQRAWSVEKNIDKDYPPVFLWRNEQDPLVDPTSSDLMEQALKAKNIPCSYHIYPGNFHGLSLGLHSPAEGWLEQALAFFF
jgi:acetyl esterase/lipase